MRACVVGVVLFAGCIDLKLPEPPGPPQPGALSGRVVIAQPGRSDRVPLKDAEIVLLGSGLATTSDATGAFLLSGITKQAGKVLLRADVDRNGTFEKQRLLSLEALQAGPGKSLSLGDVLLSDNARLEGRVLRGDAPGARGHAGSLAFVPEGPFSALTADDGTFVFNELPEGAATISVFRAGYRAREIGEVQLSSGQTLTLRDVTLLPVDAAEVRSVRLSGRVVPLPETDTSSASVELSDGTSAPRSTNVSPSGEFSFTTSQGLYTVTVRLAGYRTAVVSNVVVQSVDRDLGSIVITSGSGTVGGTGGGSAGGNTAGGNTAGGNTAGGNTAGGNTAGGNTAGGNTAGGN
ncbi:MAG: carboxypeptidase regulatory-like domain-containing protein, partial [Archangiaceae bacterium]|nr:carboxypeptidase regulatory-like domain-containing protein [Archangiaceae bacterium]